MNTPEPSTGYREHTPPPALRPYVECFWTSGASTAPESTGPHRVLPDGCVDLLFDSQSPSSGHVVGTMTRALVLDGRSDGDLVAVRFRPGGAWPFFRIPMHELTDGTVELSTLWEGTSRVEDGVARSLRPETAVAALAEELIHRLPERGPDRRIQGAVSFLETHRDPAPVRRLSDELGLSRQFLTRQFKDRVGIGPKVFARVARLQILLSELEDSDQCDWLAAALAAGYCDQAHMVGEFSSLTGLTPTGWHRERANR